MNNDFSNLSVDHLKQFIERIERLEEEKTNLSTDIKEIYTEAKSSGFDNIIIRQIIRLRKMDKAKLEEQETLLDLYKSALGMDD